MIDIWPAESSGIGMPCARRTLMFSRTLLQSTGWSPTIATMRSSEMFVPTGMGGNAGSASATLLAESATRGGATAEVAAGRLAAGGTTVAAAPFEPGPAALPATDTEGTAT